MTDTTRLDSECHVMTTKDDRHDMPSPQVLYCSVQSQKKSPLLLLALPNQPINQSNQYRGIKFFVIYLSIPPPPPPLFLLTNEFLVLYSFFLLHRQRPLRYQPSSLSSFFFFSLTSFLLLSHLYNVCIFDLLHYNAFI